MTSYEEFEPPPSRGWSPGVVALISTLVLLLGIGGAVMGVYLSGDAKEEPAGTPTTLPQVFPTVSPSPSPSPSPTPSPTVSAPAPSTGDSFGLPAVAGLDFRVARQQLRDLKLGVSLVFEGTAEGSSTVSRTEPAAGAQVRRGITVKVYVPSSAPLTTLPALMGLSCSDAKDRLGENGLFPSYPQEKTGVVLKHEPVTGPVRWNDTVKIWCGPAGATPVL